MATNLALDQDAAMAEWRETERGEGPADSPSGLRFRFITLDRV